MEPSRRCKLCRRRYPATAEFFYRAGWLANGEPKWRSYCKECDKARRQSPEYFRAYRKRRMSDPEYRAAVNQQRRVRYRRRRDDAEQAAIDNAQQRERRSGTPEYESTCYAAQQARLDPEPFRAWLGKALRLRWGTAHALGKAVGVNDKLLRDVLAGTKDTVSLDLVDLTLMVDGRDRLEDLYSEDALQNA